MENLTEGEWKIKRNEDVNDKWHRIASIGNREIVSFHGHQYGTAKANAQAIVTAVNNTYKKGINPEAVEDMKEALKKQNDWLQRLWNCSPEQRNKMINDDLNYVSGINAQALKKAGCEV